MKNEFVLAFNEVLEEKQLPKDIVLEALEAAMVSAYRRAVNASNAQHVEATIDAETGRVTIFAEKEIVESVADSRTEVSLKDARKVDGEAKLGGMVIVETTPKNFGRVAAQTARQVIQQRIREAERDVQFGHFSKQMGEIISGVVQAVNAQGVTLGLDMKAEGAMPRNQQIPGERFRVHDRVRALLFEVKPTPRGPQIILSRAHRNFLRRLLENEVPEIYHGMVEIRSIAREPGQRSKVAVAALQPGVDPVGACVGIRGVRIQAIVRELNDEKIDVIEWNPDPAVYIAKALSPARVAGVYLNEHSKGAKTATVVVPEDQLSLAIGRDGQNARLAAKLTSWRIDIKSLPEAASDSLHKLLRDPLYAPLAQNETDVMPQVEAILAKKAEGRPVTPEEYSILTQFVDRVERGLLRQRQSEKRVEDERVLTARARIPVLANEVPLADFEVSDRVYAVISEAGYQTVGDLMLQMYTDPDAILRLSGMGPKGMRDLEAAIDAFNEKAAELQPQPIIEETQIAEEIAEQPEVVEVPLMAEVVEMAAPEIIAPAIETGETPPEQVIEEQVIEEPVKQPVAALEISAESEPVVEPTKVEVTTTAAPEPTPVVSEPTPVIPITESTEAQQGAEKPIAVPTEQELPEEEAGMLDELFALRPDVLEVIEEDEDEDDIDRKKKSKRKKKFVEMEYDPDQDVMVVKKKRKRGGVDWGEDW